MPLCDTTAGDLSDYMQLPLERQKAPYYFFHICRTPPEDMVTHFTVWNWWSYPLSCLLWQLFLWAGTAGNLKPIECSSGCRAVVSSLTNTISCGHNSACAAKSGLVKSGRVFVGIKRSQWRSSQRCEASESRGLGTFVKKGALFGAVRGWLPRPDRRPLLELAATDRNNWSLDGRQR